MIDVLDGGWVMRDGGWVERVENCAAIVWMFHVELITVCLASLCVKCIKFVA